MGRTDCGLWGSGPRVGGAGGGETVAGASLDLLQRPRLGPCVPATLGPSLTLMAPLGLDSAVPDTLETHPEGTPPNQRCPLTAQRLYWWQKS